MKIAILKALFWLLRSISIIVFIPQLITTLLYGVIEGTAEFIETQIMVEKCKKK